MPASKRSTTTTKKRRRQRSRPALRFSPYAWAKLLYLRDLGETEIGGFGICPGEDLLCVEDIQLVEQRCTLVSVIMDDRSVADFFDRQVDAGLRPAQFARIWLHTHPGASASPSGTDEETFARVFGRSDWSVMFILAAEGKSYARLQFSAGPGGSQELPVLVDYSRPFSGSDFSGWDEEYLANVQAIQPVPRERGIGLLSADDAPWRDAWPEEDHLWQMLAEEEEALANELN